MMKTLLCFVVLFGTNLASYASGSYAPSPVISKKMTKHMESEMPKKIRAKNFKCRGGETLSKCVKRYKAAKKGNR